MSVVILIDWLIDSEVLCDDKVKLDIGNTRRVIHC
jgi:hypothetical protein